jgi:hypothetical protein
MFARKELEATKDYIKLKKNDILNKEGGSDWDFIQDLQTLALLGDAVDKKLHPEE